MSLFAAIKSVKVRLARAAARPSSSSGQMLDRQAMLDELRGLFADELAAHDRTARQLALESASHRQKG